LKLVNKWLCQYNPKKYKLQKAAIDPELEYIDLWPIHGEKGNCRPNAELLRKGDLCLFWKSGPNRGFVGYGIVKKGQATREIPEKYNRYVKTDKMRPVEEVIEITYEKLFDNPILLTDLQLNTKPNQDLNQEFFKGHLKGTFYELDDATWHFLEQFLLPELNIPEGSSIREFTEALVELEERSDLPEPLLTDLLNTKRTTTQRTIRDKKI
jgi:hypothetical protein